MPQSHRSKCNFGRAARLRAIVLRAVLTLTLAGAVAGLHGSMARAGDDDPDESFVSKFMRGIGIKRTGVDTSAIDYRDRVSVT